MPFKTLEERMLKYKKELEAKYANDLESEIRRLKDFEMSKLRIEEAQKYRQKIQEYRDELEVLQSDKLRELKLRESEAWERIKNRERDLDKQAFEQRQKMITNEEVLRSRENEMKKTLEVELHMVKTERDSLSKSQRDCELKLKDLEMHRIKMDKEHIEAIERYKSDLQRNFSDQDFEIHRRKLQVEEDEARIKLDRDRIAQIQSNNQTLNQELTAIKAELATFSKQNHDLFKENRDMKD